MFLIFIAILTTRKNKNIGLHVMQQKKLIYIAIATYMLSVYPLALYGMNPCNELRSLPQELQTHILFSKNFGFLRDIIDFLGFQPITLIGPHEHASSVVSVELYGDIIKTKSIHSWKKWLITLWNIHTGAYIYSNIERYKAWEEEGPAIIINDKAINIEYTCVQNEIFTPKIYTCEKTGLWNVYTEEELDSIAHEDDVLSIATYENCIAMVMGDGKVKLWNIDNKQNTYTIDPFGYATSVALNKDLIIIGLKQGYIESWNRHTLKPSYNFVITNFTKQVTSMITHNDTVLAGSKDGITRVFDIDTKTILHTLNGPNGHTAQINSIATDGTKVVTGSQDGTAKIWPLIYTTQGTHEDNPLLWLLYNTNIVQLNFIQRAYNTTIDNQEFIIDLPKKLGKIEENESQEQQDGRVYFSLPPHIREYLRNRLKIRKLARTTTEKIHVAYADNNCLIM